MYAQNGQFSYTNQPPPHGYNAQQQQQRQQHAHVPFHSSALVSAEPGTRQVHAPVEGTAGPSQPVVIHLHNAVHSNAAANAEAEQQSNQLTRVATSVMQKLKNVTSNPLVAAAVAAIAAALLHNHIPGIKRAPSLLFR